MSKARDLANGATALSAVSATELGYVDGVTSAIQTQIDTKLASSTAATTYQAINTAVSTTELGYLDGVTSAIQTQLNQKPEYAAGKNSVINGGQDFWQRGTSFTTTAAYTYCSDRWYYSTTSGGKTVSRQITGDTTNLPTLQYCIRLARNTGQTDTTPYTLHTALETASSIPLAGQTVTFSFYARKGANYSGTTVATYINTGTGTDQAASGQNAGTWTGFASPLNGSTFTPTTTWTRYSFTATIGATATQVGFGFLTSAFSGTAGAADYLEFTGLQLELGSTATTFSRAGGTIQGELAACQRYYYRDAPGVVSVYLSGTGLAVATNTITFAFKNPVSMRIPSPSIDYAELRAYDGVTSLSLSSPGTANQSTNYSYANFAVTGSTLYRGYYLLAGTSSAYVGFTAEL